MLASSRKIILMFQEKLALVSDFEFKQPEIGCLSYGATFSLFSIYWNLGQDHQIITKYSPAEKWPKYGWIFYVPYFPIFERNMDLRYN